MQKSKKRNLEIGSNAGETTTATLVFQALHDDYGFGAQRLKAIQQKIKFYAGCIREGEPGIEEFMKCMAVECGQVYPGLIACKEKYGEVKIYG